ncbi:Canalicular multispecific organic anion transporter 1 [Liparis tanakae]|uniref:Canalicular multispecific organic anion transporter 1 n=1 Tax=Liparis tanakae TaxID=230148 RepID=A0A4Z2I3F7_9TELE|nr:Canalicular multispecific organic anion transporter 1 [Liparis tanakae]
MCAAALEEYCGSIFWNTSYLNREDPDLPVCFEQTVLVWIPLGFLWLCAPRHLVSLCRRTQASTKHLSRRYIFKQLVVCLLFLTAIAALAVTLGEDYGPSTASPGKNPGVFYANPVLYAVTWILLLLCQEGVRRREGSVDSATLFLFWFFLVVCDIFPFQTLLREALRLNPEVGAAFLSRITFNWFSSMVVKGYKRPLVQADMWELNDTESTADINQSFQYFMKSELGAARVRFQNKLKRKRGNKVEEEAFQNGLGKGVSQDVLMEERGKKEDEKKKKNDKKKEENDHPNSWLITTIYKTFKGLLFESAFFKLLQDLLSFVSPQLLK